MLVLSRKKQESIVVANGAEQMLKVTVVEIRGGSVRLGFDASSELPIHRAEVWARICAENGGSGFRNGSAETADT